MSIESISAITLAVRNMNRSVSFYEKCGFAVIYGGAKASFTSLQAGNAVVNLIEKQDFQPHWWGRVIFRVADVDEVHRRLSGAGLTPQASPQDAEWGERYFQITDPDGHELSFAQLL